MGFGDQLAKLTLALEIELNFMELLKLSLQNAILAKESHQNLKWISKEWPGNKSPLLLDAIQNACEKIKSEYQAADRDNSFLNEIFLISLYRLNLSSNKVDGLMKKNADEQKAALARQITQNAMVKIKKEASLLPFIDVVKRAITPDPKELRCYSP
jgi:hypothetical protein